MAAGATIVASFSIYPKVVNFSSATHSSISLITLNFPHTKTISPKPFNPKPQLFNSLHCLPSISFHEFLLTQKIIEEDEDEYEEDEEVDEEEDEDEEQPRRLFVGNLPFSLSSSQLAELFREAGNVVSVEIVYDDIAGRSRGFAFVTMESAEDAEEAIRMFDGNEVGGRAIKVNFPEVPKLSKRLQMGSNYRGYVDSHHKIYAGNLGWDMTSQDLKEAFAEQPGLLSAKVIYERNSGKSRGFGFVSFETSEDVEAALSNMNGVEVQGRPLRLNLVVDSKKPSSPPAINQKKGNNVNSLEMLFGISK
ncbi:RNA-binding (RRM/RBD/RNP motifs) family protein [Trifolium repens]|nr:RNA-binding (RRM/RBD/RNP motifs) family protein [Trifolium repens]